MTPQGGCRGCGYSLLELAQTVQNVRCPECGRWNSRPEFLNFFPWPRPGHIGWRLCWPAAAAVIAVPLAWLILPAGLVGLLAVALAALCGVWPMLASASLVRVRCPLERQGRAIGLLAAAGIAVNLGVLLIVYLVVARVA